VLPCDALAAMSPGYRLAFAAVIAGLDAIGVTIAELDPQPFLQAGALLYGGAFVAERYQAVGAFIESHLDDCDPQVASIVLAARDVSADDLAAEHERLAVLRRQADAALAGFDGLLLPTAPFQPTIAEVAGDPIGVNARLGIFTTFCNLLGLCGYAIPAGTADGGQFGVQVLTPAGHDAAAAQLARLIAR
jgi:allophanate hydrolase